MDSGNRSSSRRLSWFVVVCVTAFVSLPTAPMLTALANEKDRRALLALDETYQAAVKANDVATMDKLLADDFVLVTGSGKVFRKPDLLKEAESGTVQYEQQDDTNQTVRVWGDTAVITAKLWEKGTDSGSVFDKHIWFSDTHVRTHSGWKYIFGQSSLPLPN